MTRVRDITITPSPAPVTDDAAAWTVDELLRRCAASPADNLAWAEFVRRYHLTIKKSVVHIFQTHVMGEMERKEQLSNDQIDDLVQGVYMRLIQDGRRALRNFKGAHDNSIFQYLAMISVNVVRDHFRGMRAVKRPKVFCSYDALVSGDGGDELDPLDAIPRAEDCPLSEEARVLTRMDIEEALRQVGDWKNRERDVLIFKLRFYEGLELREIAKVKSLRLSPMGVGSSVNRVLKKLRAHFRRLDRRQGTTDDRSVA